MSNLTLTHPKKTVPKPPTSESVLVTTGKRTEHPTDDYDDSATFQNLLRLKINQLVESSWTMRCFYGVSL